MTKQIFASILSADFARLAEEAHAIIKAGADGIHFDVMDNHYVPNLTIGAMGCEALKKAGITAPIDVHLMAKPVDRLIIDFAKAGANSITIHPESTEHLDRSLTLIKKSGCQAGLALNPGTSIMHLEPVLGKLDLILIMSVNPGFGGQSFIASSLDKIKQTRALLKEKGVDIPIMVDGGVKTDNIGRIAAAGATHFVVGSGLFNSDHYKKTLDRLKA